MPHTKNRMKLRGDIHPPEVEYDLSTNLDDDDELQAEATRLDDVDLRLDQPAEPAIMLLAVPERMGAKDKAQQIAGKQLANRPMVVMLGAFALGIVIARMVRKGARAL
jgi:hypothetical protein